MLTITPLMWSKFDWQKLKFTMKYEQPLQKSFFQFQNYN
jgi:hypothetical protein